MTILRYILVALEVVLLFNLLIGVHELGHFLAAKWRVEDSQVGVRSLPVSVTVPV